LCSNAASYASQQLSIIVDKPSPQLKDDNNEDGVDVVMSNTRTLLLRYQQCLLSHFIACNNSLNVTGDVISLSGGITGCFFFACCYFPYFPLSLQCLLGWAAGRWKIHFISRKVYCRQICPQTSIVKFEHLTAIETNSTFVLMLTYCSTDTSFQFIMYEQ